MSAGDHDRTISLSWPRARRLFRAARCVALGLEVGLFEVVGGDADALRMAAWRVLASR
jgi:hypothetical protein